jgi:imidazolonepropionase
MIDAGAAVALATDINPGSAPCPSLPLVMAIACRYQKLAPAEALQAVTINAAFATGIGAQAGSLEPGKVADLLILKTADYRSLMYEFGGNPIHTVVKRGRVHVNG